MCNDHPDIEEILDKTGAMSAGKYDPSSFDAMETLCVAYNKAVDKSLVNKVRKYIYLCQTDWMWFLSQVCLHNRFQIFQISRINQIFW